MSKLGYGKYVVCPYYKGERGQVIYCKDEGDDKVMHVAFPTRGKLREYRASNCEQRRNDCPIAYGLNKKWGYEDGE